MSCFNLVRSFLDMRELCAARRVSKAWTDIDSLPKRVHGNAILNAVPDYSMRNLVSLKYIDMNQPEFEFSRFQGILDESKDTLQDLGIILYEQELEENDFLIKMPLLPKLRVLSLRFIIETQRVVDILTHSIKQMPNLEILFVHLDFYYPTRDVESTLMFDFAYLPKLKHFELCGNAVYQYKNEDQFTAETVTLEYLSEWDDVFLKANNIYVNEYVCLYDSEVCDQLEDIWRKINETPHVAFHSGFGFNPDHSFGVPVPPFYVKARVTSKHITIERCILKDRNQSSNNYMNGIVYDAAEVLGKLVRTWKAGFKKPNIDFWIYDENQKKNLIAVMSLCDEFSFLEVCGFCKQLQPRHH